MNVVLKTSALAPIEPVSFFAAGTKAEKIKAKAGTAPKKPSVILMKL